MNLIRDMGLDITWGWNKSPNNPSDRVSIVLFIVIPTRHAVRITITHRGGRRHQTNVTVFDKLDQLLPIPQYYILDRSRPLRQGPHKEAKDGKALVLNVLVVTSHQVHDEF